MKLRVRDLRPGDEFDVIELVERQDIARLCTYGGLQRTNIGVVENVAQSLWEHDHMIVVFKADGDVYTWLLAKEQVVELKGWL